MSLTTHDIFRADAPPAVLLIRLAVGFAFLVAGTNKLLDPAASGASFAAMGFPGGEMLGPFVGVVEVLCALLVISGFATRIAAIPLIIIMITALTATKLPILVDGTVGPFGPPRGATGLMPFLTAARLDVSMLLSSIFLLLVGAGPISIDARIGPRVALHDHQLRQTAHFPTGPR